MSSKDWERNGWVTAHPAVASEIRELLAVADHNRRGTCPVPRPRPKIAWVSDEISPKTVHLYASGPGLLLHSPSAAGVFQDGVNYADRLLPGEGAIGEALSSGRVVLLSTGSPGLEYSVEFSDTRSNDVSEQDVLSSVKFSLAVTDGQLLVRDGYVTTRWGDPGYAVEAVPLQNGFYDVDARWLRSERHGHMRIQLILHLTDVPPTDCPGWVDLDFEAS